MNYSQKILELRKRAESDSYFFCKEILGYQDMEIQPHKELCEYMLTWNKRKKLVLLPRGSFKSTVVTVGHTLHALCYNPNLRVMIATENYNNSILYLKEIKEQMERNENLKLIYGDMVPLSNRDGDWTKTDITIATRTKIGGKEPSVQTSSLGTSKTGLHYDLLILDDLVSSNNTNTQDQMQKVIDYYKYLLSIADPGARIIIVGTRYHYGDLYNYIQENEKDNFDILVRGAYNKDGSLYFPTRLTEEFLQEQRKSQGSWIFSCQYQNEAIDSENAVFKEEWIQYYENPPKALNVFITIDPAATVNRTSDYTAVMVIGVDPDSNIYVLEPHQLKEEVSDWIDLVFRKVVEYNVSTVSLETNSWQRTYKHAFQQEMEKRKFYFAIYEAGNGINTKSKEARIGGLVPLFEQGKIYVRKTHTALIDQILRFPKAKNDDLLDALKDILPIMFPADAEKEISKLDKAVHLTQNEIKVWKNLETVYKQPRSVRRLKSRRV